MTEKMINKDSLALFFVTILTIVGLVYGFTTIPNPVQQRALKLDHQRVTDLGEIKMSITDYYRENNTLPQTITGLKKQYSNSEVLNITDPETGQQYEYTVTGPTSYQLCATFTTDSSKETDSYDTENYYYSSYKDDFPHEIGSKCFPLTVKPSYQNTYYPIPTQRPTTSITPTATTNPEGAYCGGPKPVTCPIGYVCDFGTGNATDGVCVKN